MKTWITAVTITLAVLSCAATAQETAPEFQLPDVNGVMHTLADYAGKTVVLEWTNYDCPFVKKFYSVGAMQAMQEHYAGKGVIWFSICSSAPGKQGHFTNEEWKRRMTESDVKATAVLLDESGVVGKAYGASNTPHIFVVGADGTIAYQGSVDNQRTADPAEIQGARNYLKEALNALISGGNIEVTKTKPYGCSVKY